MANLYQISVQMDALIERIQSCYDEETGEVVDPEALKAVEDDFNALSMDFKDKAVALAGYMNNCAALIAQMKDREEAIYKRRKALENRNKHIKQYLLDAMTAQGIKKVESPDFRISVAKTAPSVEIFDESQIPDKYWISEPRLNKALLKADLKEGDDIPGAKLSAPGKSLRVV